MWDAGFMSLFGKPVPTDPPTDDNPKTAPRPPQDKAKAAEHYGQAADEATGQGNGGGR